MKNKQFGIVGCVFCVKIIIFTLFFNFLISFKNFKKTLFKKLLLDNYFFILHPLHNSNKVAVEN